MKILIELHKSRDVTITILGHRCL